MERSDMACATYFSVPGYQTFYEDSILRLHITRQCIIACVVCPFAELLVQLTHHLSTKERPVNKGRLQIVRRSD